MTHQTNSTYELTSRETAFFNKLSSVLDVLFISVKAIIPKAAECIDSDKVTTMADVPKICFKDILNTDELQQKLAVITNYLNQYINGLDFYITYSVSHDVIDLVVMLKQKNRHISIHISFTPHICFCNKVECKIYVTYNNNEIKKYEIWMHHRIGKYPNSGFITDNESPIFNQTLLTMFYRALKEINYSNIEKGIKQTIDTFRILCN